MTIPATLAPQLKSAHRRALMATARIACLAALVGCTPKTSPQAGPTAATPTPDIVEPTPDATPQPTVAVAECQDTVEKAFADGAEPATVGNDIKACCQTIAEAADAGQLEDQFNFARRGECCTALDWQGSMACTPWGQPTPPTMTA